MTVTRRADKKGAAISEAASQHSIAEVPVLSLFPPMFIADGVFGMYAPSGKPSQQTAPLSSRF